MKMLKEEKERRHPDLYILTMINLFDNELIYMYVTTVSKYLGLTKIFKFDV
jgi:hypothetical protein